MLVRRNTQVISTSPQLMTLLFEIQINLYKQEISIYSQHQIDTVSKTIT